jgi:Carboxypeptidase regulatory-like domain
VKIPLSICMGVMFVLSLVFFQVSGKQTTNTIEGVVRDLQGNPVPQATLWAFDSKERPRNFESSTDSNGKFVFRSLPPDTYKIYAFKESAGFPYSFFFFFATSGKERRTVTIAAGQTIRDVVLELGPKHPTLRVTILNEQGETNQASLQFIRRDYPNFPYSRSAAETGDSYLVPPNIPFRVVVKADGYAPWSSEWMSVKSDETLSITARLKKLR